MARVDERQANSILESLGLEQSTRRLYELLFAALPRKIRGATGSWSTRSRSPDRYTAAVASSSSGVGSGSPRPVRSTISPYVCGCRCWAKLKMFSR